MSDPEMMARIKSAMEELAARDYPRVWIGEPGMTPEQYLALEEANDSGPEWLRIEPGEFVAIEDRSGEVRGGISVPKISHRYLDGLYVVRHMPDALHPDVYAELHAEVMHIYAAKHGQVWVTVSENLEWKPKHEITPEDRLSLVGIPGVPQRERQDLPLEKMPDVVGVAGDFRTRRVPVDALTPADVDEHTLEELEFYVSDPEPMGPYVIEETERAEEALNRRLGIH